MKIRSLKQRGDTIVEVLIVVMVLGFIIGISYAVASASQKHNRQTEERTQAVKIAEAQMEALRGYTGAIANGTKFCFNDGGQIVTLPGNTQAATSSAEPFNDYPEGCKQVPVGGSCNAYCYYVSVSKAAGDNYTVMVRWDGVNARRDQVILYYRLGAAS